MVFVLSRWRRALCLAIGNFVGGSSSGELPQRHFTDVANSQRIVSYALAAGEKTREIVRRGHIESSLVFSSLMTTKKSWEPAFERLLARHAGTGADAPAVAAAARRLCEDFAQHLTPLIGDGGVAAIYGRSLQLAEWRLSGLPARSSGQDNDPFTRVQHFLERQDPVVAIGAAVTVLAFASEALASFIGESLTRLLLHETWPDQFDRIRPEPTT